MTPSRIIFYLSFSFILGLIIEFLFKIPFYLEWLILFLGVLIILISLFLKIAKRELFLFIGFCFLFLVLGISRFQISEYRISNDDLRRMIGKEVVLEGKIVGAPVEKSSIQELKVKVNKNFILVILPSYEKYQYLDKVRIKGRLETPLNTEEFNYQNYLLKDYILAVIYFPKEIEIIGREKVNLFSFFYSQILFVKELSKKVIRKGFLPPYSSLLEGIILGDRSSLSKEIKDKFMITGLSHLLAISGMHITIFASLLSSFFLLVGFWRQQIFYLVFTFVLVYIILVGMPASAIRAGIMGIMYLLAQNIGRELAGGRVIFLTAAFMLLFNPLLLFYDIGFQLSFLSVIGIIYLEPLLRSYIISLLKKLFKSERIKSYETVLMIFSISLSAQVFTFPLVIYNFGTISLTSLITNFLVLPIVPFIMIFGVIFLVGTSLFNFLAFPLSLPCYFLLTYLFWVVDFFSNIGAYIVIKKISWVWLIIFYGILTFFIRYLYLKKRNLF